MNTGLLYVIGIEKTAELTGLHNAPLIQRLFLFSGDHFGDHQSRYSLSSADKYIAANRIAKGFCPNVVVAEFTGAACIFVFFNSFAVHDVDIAIFGVRTNGQHGEQTESFTGVSYQVDFRIFTEAGCAFAVHLVNAQTIGENRAAIVVAVLGFVVINPFAAKHGLNRSRRENLFALVGAIIKQHGKRMGKLLTGNPQAACRGKYRSIGAGNIIFQAVGILEVFGIRILQGNSIFGRLSLWISILCSAPWSFFIPDAGAIFFLVNCAEFLKFLLAEIAGQIVRFYIQLF